MLKYIHKILFIRYLLMIKHIMPKVNCKLCNKKIISYLKPACTCKCGFMFCGTHLHDHECSFDYKTKFKDEMKVINDPLKQLSVKVDQI